MHLGDARRLAVSTAFTGILLLAFLITLGLHDSGRYATSFAESALGLLPLAAWLWISLVLIVGAIGIVGIALYLVHQAPQGFARGIVRQVQCTCDAVFMIHDTGHRPITHRCPNCSALGVYDGTAEPVGLPPKPRPPERIIEVQLACQSCHHKFPVTDTGARPLNVKCPKCRARGQLR